MSNLVETPGAIIITEAEPATFGIRFFHARTASSPGPCRISCVALLGLGLSLEPRELLLHERDDVLAAGIRDIIRSTRTFAELEHHQAEAHLAVLALGV